MLLSAEFHILGPWNRIEKFLMRLITMTYTPKQGEIIQGPSSRKTGAGVKFQEDLHIHSFFL